MSFTYSSFFLDFFQKKAMQAMASTTLKRNTAKPALTPTAMLFVGIEDCVLLVVSVTLSAAAVVVGIAVVVGDAVGIAVVVGDAVVTTYSV